MNKKEIIKTIETKIGTFTEFRDPRENYKLKGVSGRDEKALIEYCKKFKYDIDEIKFVNDYDDVPPYYLAHLKWK